MLTAANSIVEGLANMAMHLPVTCGARRSTEPLSARANRVDFWYNSGYTQRHEDSHLIPDDLWLACPLGCCRKLMRASALYSHCGMADNKRSQQSVRYAARR